MLGAWLSSKYLIDYSSDNGLWMLVGLTAVVSGLMTAWAGFLRLRPAWSLFHIFCFASIASYPATAPLGDGMFVASATIGLALLLGQAGRLWHRHRTPWTVTAPVEVGHEDGGFLRAGAVAADVVGPWSRGRAWPAHGGR